MRPTPTTATIQTRATPTTPTTNVPRKVMVNLKSSGRLSIHYSNIPSFWFKSFSFPRFKCESDVRPKVLGISDSSVVCVVLLEVSFLSSTIFPTDLEVEESSILVFVVGSLLESPFVTIKLSN